MAIGFIPGEIDRLIPPPTEGGFFYLKRKSDGCILLDHGGDYVRFDERSDAELCAEYFGEDAEVRFMPRQRVN